MRERGFLGLRFVDASAAAGAALIAARPPGAPFAYVVTPNADHFVRLRRMPNLRAAYEGAEWRFLDSTVTARAARLLGLTPPAVATGADMTAILLDHHLCAGDSVTVIGLEALVIAALRQRLPMITVAHFQPPRNLAENCAGFEEAVVFAVAHPGRFTFLAVGSPVQERLAAAICASGGGAGTALCVGAAVEFWVGSKPRAPQLMRDLGLEWLYRLCREPRRLAGRYLGRDWAIFGLLLEERLRRTAVR
jgi:N-acetylglucosaminyldiphosphoundecaprenol N-acetyl-beta-D-mannosaminyltransferase